MMLNVIGLLLIVSLSFSAACGKKKDKKVDTATVKVAMSNATASSLALDTAGSKDLAATVAQIKIAKIQLVTDESFTSPSLIWHSPSCPVTVTKNDDDSPHVDDSNCSDSDLAYFDLARTSDAVNADLNSQGLPVAAGTYRFVQVSLCGTGAAASGDQSTPHLKFKATGMSASYESKGTPCAYRSVEANPPVVLSKDDNVVVSLAYDLSKAVSATPMSGNGTGGNCTMDNGVNYCWTFPTLTPSFTKK